MPELALYNREGSQVGEIELNQNIFDVEINEHVVHEAVTAQLAAKRSGTAATKTRGKVSGGGRKPWRQKGTGRARHGSIRSPIWVGGGTTFGPQPRDYSKKLPKKVKKLAVKSALTAKVNEDELIVVDKLDFAQPKTKEMVKVLEALNSSDQKVLIVTSEKDANLYKSARNIPGVNVLIASALNVYDILNCNKLIATKDAIEKVEEVLD
ncbi:MULTISPECIES: 50S ribosomal protein L4 [unclassified Candidatus Frackibacter]|jgi:large subunit ribosomal protein L4|uniref:50S ribosomal protein L4 n=1 Tax=unclassified Candidatus Frackibacter TaxID=2648818 RepID=UPI0007954332|nr:MULTISPECIES: 50S ribosomal protein L4 [unclassified Candidatus Frackibacter]KXS45766.1 MAG: large subunit ribosomal protein L4 [Candidatus Frackibacter sp. T328-2]SDC22033.1 LSU ribosomal protein L4P [Candidatus Frackibacter sp. WG11]SEM49849.1 LSU ribosomal protein L4P [Candidatus Frackibacter sp. WG12]SFL51306.1 LSU ribosomal protein L4P [Candidatus Frackibacter sp. WG13]